MMHGFQPSMYGCRHIQSSITDTARPATGSNAGATVTAAGSTHTKGSYTNLLTASGDAYWITVSLVRNGTPTTQRFLTDIGIDPATGSSYTVIIPNLASMYPPNWFGGTRNDGNSISWIFPCYIPSGSNVGARCQCNTASASLGVIVELYGKPMFPIGLGPGRKITALTASTSTTLGTAVTFGTSSEGTWTSLGTVPYETWYMQHGFSMTDPSSNAGIILLDFAYGDSSNKVIIANRLELNYCGGATETHGEDFRHPLGPVYIPGGTTLWARGIVAGSLDNDTTVVAYLAG